MSDTNTVGIGIIGGGLMGREMASAFARWCALEDSLPQPELRAVADTNPAALSWFDRIPSVAHQSADYHDWIDNPDIDVCYVAVPHDFHENIYTDVLKAGKDLMAEKPFGIDLASARRIADAARESDRFVRCSSEFPYFPGARAAHRYVESGVLGRPLEIVSGFHHGSDLDPSKPPNWKRQSATCGKIGVLGDLGMHTLHLPLRLGWKPEKVYAQLQNGYPTRPGPDGPVVCDTFDNAMLHTWVDADGHTVPMRLEMKRLAPGQTNTWFVTVLGTDGGVSYSTAEPKTLRTFSRDGQQEWKRMDLGFGTDFKTITGGIFEVGFPDVIQQMWAAYLTEREGTLGDRLGCVTPEEAVASQIVFDAALRSHDEQAVTTPQW